MDLAVTNPGIFSDRVKFAVFAPLNLGAMNLQDQIVVKGETLRVSICIEEMIRR